MFYVTSFFYIMLKMCKYVVFLLYCLTFTALMLNELVKDGIISEYIFIHIPAALTDLQGSEQVCLHALFIKSIIKFCDSIF